MPTGLETWLWQPGASSAASLPVDSKGDDGVGVAIGGHRWVSQASMAKLGGV